MATSHPWARMVSLCTLLVEAYGDQTVAIGGLDGVGRLKMAVVYLTSAIRIANMFNLLTNNPIVLSADDSFTAPTSPELQKLISSSFSTSVSPDSTTSSITPPPAAAAGAPAGKGKAAPPPAKGAGAAPVVSGGLTGRDAVLLLTNLLRESDELWPDGHEMDVAFDTHQLLMKSYPIYKSKCTLESLPDLSENAALSIPVSAVYSLWSAVSPPEGFLSSLSSKPNTFGREHYSSSGCYSHIAAYFLLGDKASTIVPVPVAPAPPVKGAQAEPPKAVNTAPVNSVQPVLTKLILPRVDLLPIEKELRNVRSRLMDARAKSVKNAVLACNDQFSELMKGLVWLLQNGTIFAPGSATTTPTTAGKGGQVKIVEIQGNSNLEFALQITLQKNGSTITVPITEQFMLNLANIFSSFIAVDSLVDNDCCAFLRMVLGYE